MTLSTLTSKGQATIPKPVRDQLGIKPGDQIEFVTTPMGHIVLLPKTATLASLKNILPKPEKPASIQQINDARKPSKP